jgi:hypothetical protein
MTAMSQGEFEAKVLGSQIQKRFGSELFESDAAESECEAVR